MTKQGEEFQERLAADLLTQPDPGPTPYLVESLITEAAIGVIQGAPKVGKTWVVLELARAIVTGAPAFGRFAIPEDARGDVLIILEESGEAALRRRLDALLRGNAQRPNDLGGANGAFELRYATNCGVQLDDEWWQEELRAAVDGQGYSALFLDPFVRMKGAGRDESSQADIDVVLSFLRELRELSGMAVCFAHHTGHEGERLRGSSDLEAVWESKLAIKKVGEHGRAVRSEHREAESAPAWRFRFAWDRATGSVRLIAAESELEEKVAEYLRADPEASANAVAEALEGHRRADVLAAVKALKEADVPTA